jgi:hypothetical protein
MLTTQEAIARLRMIFETQGADAAAAEMKKLETAETSLGTTSLNLDRSFANLERRYSETARATAEYERAMRTLNSAVAQNPALAGRAAAVEQTVAARYQATMQAAKQAHEAQTAYGIGMQALSAQAQVASASTGILGTVLGTFGTFGSAAAVGVGATVLAVHKLDEGVAAFAQRARAISEFAETTGLTTREVQGLSKEAARFGIDSEKMQTGLQRFVSQMDEFRQGGGQLLEIVRSIDGGLAEQMQQTEDTGQQLKLLQQVIEGTTDAFKKARLERAAFGRGGLALGQMDFAAGLQRTGGIPEETVNAIKLLQGAIDASSTNISNKIYASFAEPWLQAKKAVLEYLEAVVKAKSVAELSSGGAATGSNIQTMMQGLGANFPLLNAAMSALTLAMGLASSESKKLVSDQERLADAFQKTAAAAPAAAAGAASKTLTAQIADLQDLQRVLGALMPVEQQVELATKQLEKTMSEGGIAGKFKQQVEEAKNSLLALKRVQAELSQVAPGTYERQHAAIQAIKAQYPGLVAQDAIRMSLLKDQLGVARAVTGIQRMEAEEQARINQLKLEGKDIETAMLIAAQERANAEAAVNANVERQVISLQESTQLLNAQLADMQEQAGSAQKILGIHEMMVRTQQAYTQAIREGADEEHASALAAATYNNLLSQRAIQLEQIRQAQQQQAQQAMQQANEQANQEAAQSQQAFNQRMSSAQAASQQALGEQIRSLAQAGSGLAQQILAELEGPYGAAFLWNAPQMGAFIDAARNQVAGIPRQQRETQALDQLKQLQDQSRLGGAATDQEKAQIQAQITYEKLIKEGVSASVAQQIANQELANTMQELAKSVDANTTALQSQLDPIYTEGRAALRIGYYGEGSGGTQRVVTGTGYANENVPAGGSVQPSGNNLIVINNNFAAGAVMGDRRTQYQAANAYGRAIAATGK